MVVSRHHRLTGRSDDRSNRRSGVPGTRRQVILVYLIHRVRSLQKVLVE